MSKNVSPLTIYGVVVDHLHFDVMFCDGLYVEGNKNVLDQVVSYISVLVSFVLMATYENFQFQKFSPQFCSLFVCRKSTRF